MQTIAGSYAVVLQNKLNLAVLPCYTLRTVAQLEPDINKLLSSFYSDIAPSMYRDMEPADRRTIMNMQLAPKGIVSAISPLAGNEGAIGHDILHDPNREAGSMSAIKKENITMVGPLTLIQGGVALIARLPIFSPVATLDAWKAWEPAFETHFGRRLLEHEAEVWEDPNGVTYWWGFSTVLVAFNDLMENSGLTDLPLRRLSWSLVVPNVTDGVRYADRWLAGSGAAPKDPERASISVQNGVWDILLAPEDGFAVDWVGGAVAGVVLASLIAGMLVMLVMYQRVVAQLSNDHLRATANRLEQKRDEVEEARSQQKIFLSYVCHEVRNPLASMSAGLELLRLDETLLETADEEVLIVVDTMHHSLAAATRILDDTLSISRIEEGKLVLEQSLVTLSTLCTRLVSNMQQGAQKKGVDLRLRLPQRGGDLVYADPYRIQQIVQNLVNNALKFTPIHGTVTVSVVPKHYDTEAAIEVCKIRVADTGCGMAQEDIGKLFQTYSQISAGKNQQGGGTGLGLAISKSIALLHGGDITVESEVGLGSQFIVSLPTAQQAVRRDIDDEEDNFDKTDGGALRWINDMNRRISDDSACGRSSRSSDVDWGGEGLEDPKALLDAGSPAGVGVAEEEATTLAPGPKPSSPATPAVAVPPPTPEAIVKDLISGIIEKVTAAAGPASLPVIRPVNAAKAPARPVTSRNRRPGKSSSRRPPSSAGSDAEANTPGTSHGSSCPSWEAGSRETTRTPGRGLGAVPGHSASGRNLMAARRQVRPPMKQLLQGFSIMVVDDDMVVRTMTCMLLRKLGATVNVASNGKGLLDFLQYDPSCMASASCHCWGCTAPRMAGRPELSLVLMDGNMPEMHGDEALVRLRKQEAAQGETPQVVGIFTGDVLDESVERFTRAGASFVLSKPLNLQKFQEALTLAGFEL